MKKKISLVLLLSLFILQHSFAQMMLSDIITADQQQELLTNAKITNTGKSLSDIILMPKNTALQANLQSEINKVKMKSVAESLYLLPNKKGANQLSLYHNLLNIASLKGLQFYSRGDKKMKELIYETYLVDSFASKNKIDAPRPSAIPARWQGVMMQDDETFGAKYYDVIVYANENEILMTTQNIEKLTQGIVTTAKPKEMLIVVYLMQTDAGLLIYQLVVTAQGIPGFVQAKAYESLFNRQEAYKNWIERIYP
ncbi:DUF6675 family protein [Entomospira culicis]|uniref:Uncharacterized protein n=1 Tax=Entomospira culicis TaxID=2719989 RepID=A0A968GG96_9SPIO|nr:DUF6675 family protein [Entomospira culicis]NIZ19802.1 hypothetical protein [Entomospira culicis]NIZ70016.1 hypothetical protein [Entomospira culicis]WDI37121.1 hypothetical protein PVA46_07320 [Entomospira culicis]WDI38750.1 hypothetical protein PVA47_07330 [Entomospira culicis]